MFGGPMYKQKHNYKTRFDSEWPPFCFLTAPPRCVERCALHSRAQPGVSIHSKNVARLEHVIQQNRCQSVLMTFNVGRSTVKLQTCLPNICKQVNCRSTKILSFLADLLFRFFLVSLIYDLYSFSIQKFRDGNE